MLLGAKSAAVDWLVVGLGNPGAKYEHTRHNMGFLTVDLLAEQAGVKLNKVKFKSAYNIIPFAGSKCLVMKPQTYMNLSGEAVREAVQFYKIPADQAAGAAHRLRRGAQRHQEHHCPPGDPGLPPDQDRHRRAGRRGRHDRLGHRRALPGGAEGVGGELPPGHRRGGMYH